MVKEKICQFNIIKVNIPQGILRKLFYSHRYLTSAERRKISRKLAEIEGAIYKLQHCKSIVERIALKGLGSGT